MQRPHILFSQPSFYKLSKMCEDVQILPAWNVFSVGLCILFLSNMAKNSDYEISITWKFMQQPQFLFCI